MQETNQTPKYFRLITKGEDLVPTDLFTQDDSRLVPNGSEGYQLVIDAIVLRPVQVDEWIDYAKQRPTMKDANPYGSVQFFYENGSSESHGPSFHNFDEHNTPTHWRRVTPPVRTVKRVTVDSHQVIPNPDGSLKVGCQKISRDDFDEIVRQREAAMKGQQ